MIRFSSNTIFAKELKLIHEKSFNVRNGENLIVKTDVGDVTVKTWDNKVVSIKIYGDKDAEAKMEFSFNQSENSVEVIGEKEGGKLFGWFSRIELKFEITVPREFNLNLKTSGGDLVARNIMGEFQLKTSGGDIYLNEAEGNLDASTSGGDINLLKYLGDIDVSTSGGDIEISASKGKTFASTSGGDIVIKSTEGEVNAKTSGGDISLNYSGENYGVNLATSGGDIDVKLPANFNANVEIKTSGGKIYNSFTNTQSSKMTKSKLEGKFNNGGKNLRCSTSGGDINITQK
ncbi:MAG: DUF4097 family beta strand repeat protein [Ignavibacteriales bacterium]|nr:DUF4097 family beta strand repeat protein [Ignavibacteriales bacterium]